MSKKIRLDQLIVNLGLAETRSKAQALILSGKVIGNDRIYDKPGQQVSDDLELVVKGQEHPWVSRGGMKLAKALDEYQIDVTGKVAIDVGASTGGFTDVLLCKGAQKVYAVDVGHGQLAWKLRNDARVVVLEKTNARNLDSSIIAESVDVVVCDASFIGLEIVLPAALALTKPSAMLVTLIKPQFEVGKEQVGKGGVVRDPELHAHVCERIEAWVNGLEGWDVKGVTQSPITGPKGNVEFLLYAVKGEAVAEASS